MHSEASISLNNVYEQLYNVMIDTTLLIGSDWLRNDEIHSNQRVHYVFVTQNVRITMSMMVYKVIGKINHLEILIS